MWPVLFHISGYEIPTYPFIILITGIISAYLLAKRVFRAKLRLPFLTENCYTLALLTLAGARIGGVLSYWSYYSENWLRFFKLLDNNYNFYAGLMVLLVSIWVLCCQNQEDFKPWFKQITISLIHFQIGVEVANFLAGKNYGTPSDLPWAITLNLPNVRYTMPTHPLPIYYILAFIGISHLNQYWEKKHKSSDLNFALRYLLLFVIVQAGLGFFKGSPETLIYNISLETILSAIIAFGIVISFILQDSERRHWFIHK
ncbi:MAG TPA: prolipoprotein diacylglyceryl transferase [Candidatus Gracilibacteria bacterium]|nr:prolipoprotein diacylglyceryl transferase [Candidatus Gracilibacteria bacterium]